MRKPLAQEQHVGKGVCESMPRTQAVSNQVVDLMTTMLTADTPFAEVLATVHQQVLAIFTEPRCAEEPESGCRDAASGNSERSRLLLQSPARPIKNESGGARTITQLGCNSGHIT